MIAVAEDRQTDKKIATTTTTTTNNNNSNNNTLTATMVRIGSPHDSLPMATPSPTDRSPRRPSRIRSGSGTLLFGPPSPNHEKVERVWTRVFTRCRVFVVGILVGCFIAQSFTIAVDLCGNSSIHSGVNLPIPPSNTESLRQSSVPTNAARVPIETQPGNYSSIRDFERLDGVVIATKIHGPDFFSQLRQSFCLLKAAYNDRMLYDHLVFTTIPLSDHQTKTLTEIVHPANLRIITDELTLSDQIKKMTRMQRMILKRRCKVNSTEDLYWWTRCCEEGATGICMSLAYTWQSEFRAKHLWTHEALQNYKTMMWFDSDAMPTRVWDTDPVAVHRRNGLKMLFAHFPQGKSAGEDLMDKIHEAFNNETICSLRLQDGHLFKTEGNCRKPALPNIHGFFHITDLDFYRQPEILNWFNILIGDSKFSRRWDDQLAVTIPSAMRAADLSWEMEALGVKNDVWHNQFFDGKYRWRGGGYQKWWSINGTTWFPKAAEMCQGLITNSG